MKTTLRSLIGVLALVLLASVASAQYVANDGDKGDGDNPYIGTPYAYTVTPGAGSIEWLVYTNNDLTGLVTAGAGTYTISDPNVANPTITWNAAAGTTYYLTYKETLNSCSTYRGVVVILETNTFNIAMDADVAAVCNVKEGDVLNWDNYDQAGEEVKTSVDYVVNMTKDGSFSIDSWEFKGTLSLPGDLAVANSGDITISGSGTLTVLGGVDNKEFTITGIPAGETSVTISVDISSLVSNGGVAPLGISLGKAIKGVVETASVATGNQSQSNTLKALPAASNISF